MRNSVLILFLGLSGLSYSQVGINTETPAATLDVVGKPLDASKLDGIIAPRLSGDELSAKIYTSAQTGALVYANAAANSLTGQVINVDAAGYYYFDGSVWQKLEGDGSSSTEPWNVFGTTDPAIDNTQDIYQMGKVAVGINPSSGQPYSAQLEVNKNHTAGGSVTSWMGDIGIVNTHSSNFSEGSVYGIKNQVTRTTESSTNINTAGIYGSITENSNAASGVVTGADINTNVGGIKPWTAAGSGIIGIRSFTNIGKDISLGGGSAASGIFNSFNLMNNGSNSFQYLYGLNSNVNVRPLSGGSHTVTNLSGGNFLSAIFGSATANITNFYGVNAEMELLGSGGNISISRAALIRSYANIKDTAAKSITDLYGILVDKAQTGSNTTITNAYGIYINDYNFNGGNPLTSYNLYSQGTASKNFFEGKVGIGSGANQPTETLDIAGGNLRVRDINTNAGTAADKYIVADANGILKTIPKQTALLVGGDLSDALTTTTTLTSSGGALATTILNTYTFIITQKSLVTFSYDVGYTVDISTVNNGSSRFIGTYFQFTSKPAASSIVLNSPFANVRTPFSTATAGVPGYYSNSSSARLVLEPGSYTVTLSGNFYSNGTVNFGESAFDHVTIVADPNF